MPKKPRAAAHIGKEALETLRLMLLDGDVSDSSRVAAAKTLLERFLPLEDDEARQREAEEREASIAEAKCLLAELALIKSAGADGAPAVAEGGASEATDAAG